MNAIAPTLNDRTSFRRPVRIAVVLCLVCALAFGMMVTAYATPAIQAGITNGMKEAFDLLKAIVTPIAAVVFAIYGLGMLFGGQRGMESGKKGMLICALAIAAVWLAPLAVEAVKGWFDGVGESGVFSSSTPS